MLARQAAGDGHHVDGIQCPVCPDRRGVEGPVGVAQVGQIGIEVPGVGRQLLRRGRLVAQRVHNVEGLGELDQLDVVIHPARASAPDLVVDRRRTSDEGEVHEILTQPQLVRRVAGGQLEIRRAGCQRSLDEVAADTHPTGLFIGQGAGTDKLSPGVGGHEFDAKIFENVQGGFVDLLQRLGVDQLDPAQSISTRAGKGLSGADLGLAGLGGAG